MGIRFFCPNKHRLNVKKELAGKVGFCPICNVRMLIPSESTRDSGEDYHEGCVLALAYPETDSEPMEHGIGETKNGSDISRGKSLSHFNVDSDEPDTPAVEIIRQVVDSSSQNTQNNRTQGTLRSGVGKNLSEYWRMWDVNNVEYGPVPRAIFLQWIHEKRIGPKTLIKREDWSEPRAAETEFMAEIQSVFETNISVSSEPGIAVELTQDNQKQFDAERITTDVQGGYGTQRRKKAMTSFMLICGLILLSLLLLGVLIVILIHQSRGSNASVSRGSDVYIAKADISTHW